MNVKIGSSGRHRRAGSRQDAAERRSNAHVMAGAGTLVHRHPVWPSAV